MVCGVCYGNVDGKEEVIMVVVGCCIVWFGGGSYSRVVWRK